MGASMVMKQINDKGQPSYVKLSGLDKARVYEMLAKFGVYEMEPKGSSPTQIGAVAVVDHPEVEEFDKKPFEVKKGEEKMLRVDRKERIDMLNKIDASTMHCCEAAEIIFEDIT